VLADEAAAEAERARAELAASDPAMAALIERLGPRALEQRRNRGDDPFAGLARIITAQQVSTAAARTVWDRVCDEFGGRAPGAADAAAGEQRLREAGLSGRKASYIAGVGAAISSGELDLEALIEAEDEVVMEELLRLRGLGRWSGEMYLMFELGRADVFSGGDLALRNGIRLLHDLEQAPSAEEAEEISQRWRPNRSLAAIYLWAAASVELPN
jgi:DNA-3-methyladenine glycosylase II